MKTSFSPFASLLFSLAATIGMAGSAWAHDGGEELVQPLMKQALADVPGKNVMMATVTLAPGQSAAPHLHPGSIFAYVLEGAVTSQLEGQEPKTYTAGQSWYEPPRAHHLVTRNAGNRPATLLVWAIVGPQDPIKLPLPQTSSLAPALPTLASH
ncbi:cupin domain-containing protein [Dyella telluris]|uniref:Cupin domain-containing protein n=1 Tax=Dyella telluris TaxID=2763498 RepID=A0A7G8Q2T1_9GAMM|nr:cupin domain-containing protein [Dyella telluris]QNK01089.1 cupin domain-containing protein [Dyella telluris]